MTRLPLPATVAVLLLGAAGAAAADTRHDSNAPVDFSSNRIEVQDREHKATLIGDVRAVQGEMTLTADRVVALYSGSVANAQGTPGQASGANPKVQRMDANGHVVVTRPGEVARGNYGIYDLQTKLVTLVGNVSLDRNGSVVRGGRLVIDQSTDRATIDGSAVGGAGTSGRGGRVSGRFIVDQGNAPAPTPPAKR